MIRHPTAFQPIYDTATEPYGFWNNFIFTQTEPGPAASDPNTTLRNWHARLVFIEYKKDITPLLVFESESARTAFLLYFS